MSVYNGQKYLKEQIESILRQIDIDVELYIRDDGSSDQSVKIIEEYCLVNDSEKHFRSRMKIFFRENLQQEILSLQCLENFGRYWVCYKLWGWR